MSNELTEDFKHLESEGTTNPFRCPGYHWFLYPWLGLFLTGVLGVGIASYIKFDLSISSMGADIVALYAHGGIVLITVLSALYWLLVFVGRSYLAVEYNRSQTFKELAKPILWAERVRSDQSQGYVYLGTRLRSVGGSSRHQVLSTNKVVHTLLLGHKRTGLWERFFEPHLTMSAEWKTSSVIIDPESTLKRAKRYGSLYANQGYDVQIFTPYEAHSHHLYLLEGAHDLGTAQELAAIVVPTEATADEERGLLAILIFGLSKRGPVTLGAIARLLKTNRREVESILVDVTEPYWGFDMLSASVYDRLAARLESFENENLCRFSRPDNAHTNINLGYGNYFVFAYLGLPANIPGRDILLRLFLRLVSKQLLTSATNLVNPILFLPHLEVYGFMPKLAQMLQLLRSEEVSVCTSLPSAQVGMKIYGRGFYQLKTAFDLSIRFPRYSKPSDIELFRPISANLKPKRRYTHMGNIWQRLKQPAKYEPLLIPWHEQFRWTADAALLQSKGERPRLISLPNRKEYSKTSGLLEQLATRVDKQTFKSVDDLINSREVRSQLALEAGSFTVDVAKTEDVVNYDYSETEEIGINYEQEVDAATNLEDTNVVDGDTIPQKLTIEIWADEESTSQGNANDTTTAIPTQSLSLGSSLSGKSLHCVKAWGIKSKTKAVEVLNKRVKNNQNSTKAAPYYYQKRSFALSLDKVSSKELAWLRQRDAHFQEISLRGHENSVKVVVIPEDLAVQRPNLCSVIRTHLHELEGSAPFQTLKVEERESVVVVGRYYPRLMLVSLGTLNKVLKKVGATPPDDLEEVRLSVAGKNPRFREILVDDAPFLGS